MNRNTVVWASAGTGKTRKLVEVYLELLERGVDPLRIVAVTFTEKAAAEMRDRIRAALYARKDMQCLKAIALLPAAPITTIHGFCGILLRAHGLHLGIDPSFTILDEQRSLDLAREAARDTIRHQIRCGCEEVEQLFGDYGLERLVETMVSAGYWVNSLGMDGKWLEARVEDQRRAAAVVEKELAEPIRKYGGDWEKIGELADELEARKAKHPLRKRDQANALLPRVGQIAGVAAAERLSRLVALSLERFRSKKRFLNAMDFDDLLLGVRDLLRNHPEIRRHYQTRFQALLVDEFQDTDEVQAEIISLLAEDPESPGRLGAGKLMVVGDPKQSIYRFRRARVAVFFRMLQRILDEGGAIAHLQENYRSAPPIADFCNRISRAVMDGKGKLPIDDPAIDLSYRIRFKDEDQLKAKSEAPFLGITYVAAESGAKAAHGREMEVEALARLLKEWKSSGRIQSWKEVALLLRAMTNLEVYLRALEAHGIPVYVVQGTAFYQKSEVSDLIAFLELVLHPDDDLLRAIVLTSPLCGLTAGELYPDVKESAGERTEGVDESAGELSEDVDESAGERTEDVDESAGGRTPLLARRGARANKQFVRKRRAGWSLTKAVSECVLSTPTAQSIEQVLEHWIDRRDSATAAEILQDVIRKTNFDVVMMAQKNGPQRAANIGKLIEITRDLARQGTTALDDVVRCLRDRAHDASVREPEAQIVGQDDDVVRLLTVHQAKGLEFDIVIIPDLAAKTGRGMNDRTYFSDRWGILAGAAYGLHRKPLPHALILEAKDLEEDQQYEEEKRLLYVAATRARKMLVLGEGFSKQTGPWLQWMEQFFESVQPGAIEKARDGKTGTIKFNGYSVKVLPASQLNIPEQLAFGADTILVGEPDIRLAPPPRSIPALEMTPSDLSSLSGCLRWFHWTRILGVSEPGREGREPAAGDTPQMRLGSMAHHMLEAATPPTAEALAAAGLSDLASVFESTHWRDLDAASPEREMPFVLHLNVAGRNCWVRGRMDAVVAGDVPRVIDFKYAAWRDGPCSGDGGYETVMAAYSLALMKALAAVRAIGELWYLKSPIKIVRREYNREESELRIGSLLAKYLDALEKDEWPAAERAYCDRLECGFRRRCWSAS